MADDKSTDILMMVVVGGNAIAAESPTTFKYGIGNLQPPMLDGFKAGFFFELDEISFSLAKADASAAVGAAKQGAATDIGDIQVSRKIDQASLTLMESCFTGKTLTSAAVVKRRSAGTDVSGEPYLRLDFTGVLITKMDWTDAEMVKEKFTFKCRAMTFQYRPQKASGDLGPASLAEWKQVT